MKKLLLFCMALCVSISAFSQSGKAKHNLYHPLRNVAFKKPAKTALPSTMPGSSASQDRETRGVTAPNETRIGTTRYDLQSNSAVQNRIYAFPDGTIGGTWTFGLSDAAFPDRGSGYNFFDGASWGPEPTQRIETIRTGWPSYAAFGETGEIVLCHDFSGSAPGIIISKRTPKGSGAWTQSTFPGPVGHIDLAWPRMVTSGVNHDTVQLIANTKSIVNGGTPYQGLDGSIVYSRSPDGGITWDKTNLILPGMTAAEYTGFSADIYAWAEPKENTIAFVVGDNWTDLFLMKSTDNGDTWTKKVIFQHPYPHFLETHTLVLDTLTVCDGAMAVALDNDGKAHVFFGLMRVLNEDTTDAVTSYFPYTDGLGYWNEDMPTLTNISRDSLYDQNRLVGWFQDFNGNDTMDLMDIGTYYLSLNSMPSVTIDQDNDIYLLMSNIVESLNNGSQNYRHVMARASFCGGTLWTDFQDLTGGITHNFDECVFPSVAAHSASNIYYLYQADEEPGLAVRGDADPYGDNMIIFSKVPKSDCCSLDASFTVDHDTVNLFYSGLVQFTDASTGGAVSWSWDFGDGDTSSLQNPAHTFTAIGDFTVKLTAGDIFCAYDDFTKVIHVFIGDGINENNNLTLVSQNIPNPFTATTDINVTLAKASDLSLEVSDLVGKKILSQGKGNVGTGNYTFTLDASLLEKGIYFYTVKAGSHSVTRKMVVD